MNATGIFVLPIICCVQIAYIVKGRVAFGGKRVLINLTVFLHDSALNPASHHMRPIITTRTLIHIRSRKVWLTSHQCILSIHIGGL